MRGVMVDLFDRTINYFLHGPNFIPLVTSQEFYHRMMDKENQFPCLAQVMADGKLEWLHNPSARIFKSLMTQEVRVWWGVVHCRLMPTTGDNIIGEDRAVLVDSLLSNLLLYLPKIIADKIKIWVMRPYTGYLFPRIIIKLFEASLVTIITGLDKEIHAKKTHYPIRFDGSKPMLVLEKGTDLESDPT